MTKDDIVLRLIKGDIQHAGTHHERFMTEYGISQSVMHDFAQEPAKFTFMGVEINLKDNERIKIDRAVQKIKESAFVAFTIKIRHYGAKGEIINTWGWQQILSHEVIAMLPAGMKITDMHPTLKQFESCVMAAR